MQESLTIGGLDQSALALVRACGDLCGHRFWGIEQAPRAGPQDGQHGKRRSGEAGGSTASR